MIRAVLAVQRPVRTGVLRAVALGVAASLIVAPSLGREERASPPAAAAAQGSPVGASAIFASLGGARPGIQYEEAMAHASDRIAFAPGDRVSVPFRPRPEDRWSVGGRAARPLPAGRASGQAMATARQGSVWADGAGTAPSAPRSSADPGAGDVSTASYVAPADRDPAADSMPVGLRRQVLGFLPYWELGSGTVLKYSVLSTIAYFGVNSDAAGNLQKQGSSGPTVGWGGWTSAAMTTVINNAHAKGTRVVLTVELFGWSTSQASAQLAFLTNPTARANLAAQVSAAVRDRGADGVNLDFEPIVQGGAAGFVAFVRTLRASLDAVSPGYELTIDTTGFPGNYDLENLFAPGAADAAFIMGYDYRSDSSSAAGSISPLAGPAYDLTQTVQSYVGRIPASKVILGLPWYGRAWSTTTDAPNAPNQSGAQYGYSTAVVYDTAAGLAAQYGRNYDPIEQSAWFAYQRQNCTSTYGCVTSWREVYYDDAQSLGAKYDLVNRYKLRGAGIWTLGYDGNRPELYQALANHFLDDKVPPLTGIVNLPATEGDEGFSVSWTGYDDWSGVASYDVQVSTDGGPWTDWLTATSATSDVYLGASGHSYAFRVRGRDGKNNLGAWIAVPTAAAAASPPTLAVGGFGRVNATTLNLRSVPSVSGSRIGTVSSGAVLAVLKGPVQADGYSWYQVTLPVTEWQPVGIVQTGVWIAATDGTTPFVVAIPAPNTTSVSAAISGVSFGDAGPASIGAGAAAIRSLSPNGDGRRDALTLHWTNARPLDNLALRVFRSDGTSLGSVPVAAAAGPQSFDWPGSVGGAPLPDGTYMLQLAGTSAGQAFEWPSATPVTPAQLTAFGLTIDTVPPPGPVTASVTPPIFSPNGDGQADTIAAAISVGGASSWSFEAAPETVDATGAVVVGPAIRTMTGSGATARLTWDGHADDGSDAPDGRYRVTLAGLDPAGNPAARTFEVVIDRTIPVTTLVVTPPSFSPNGDRVADTAAFAWTSSVPVSGTLGIYSGTRLVQRWAVSSSTGSTITWNGRTLAGTAAGDGRYSVRLDVHNAAATRVGRAASVIVDRTAGALRTTPALFYPQDRDTLAPTSTVSFVLARTATTKLAVLDASGAVVRTAWSSRTLGAGTRTWIWDGRTNAGAFAAPGVYTVRLAATSSLGTVVLTRTVVAAAFLVSGAPASAPAGSTLTLTIRSAEPLVAPPTISIVQSGTVVATAKAAATAALTFRVTIAVPAPGPFTVTIQATDTGRRVNRASLAMTAL